MTAVAEASGAPGEGRDDARRRYIQAGLELLGLAATDAEMAVIEAADGLYRPLIDRLVESELDGIEPEAGTDVSHAPQ